MMKDVLIAQDNIGKQLKVYSVLEINDIFLSKRNDLFDSIIEAEGKDFIVIRTTGNVLVLIDNIPINNKQCLIDKWCLREL